MIKLVDPKVGIVTHTYMQFREPDDPHLFNATSVVANTERYANDQRIGAPPQGNGAAGVTKKACLIAAIGESIERYGCSQVDTETEIFGSFENLRSRGYSCFPPKDVALFSDTQYRNPRFPYREFDNDSTVSWCLCEDITGATVNSVYFPSSLIFMPFSARPGEQILAPTISTGQACGRTLDHATLSAVMEAVERDAFVISWLNRLPSPRLDIGSSERVGRFLQHYFSDCPMEVTLNLLTLDVRIPVVVATGVDRRNPHISCTVGVGAGVDGESAAIKALVELGQDRFYVKHLARTRHPVRALSDYSNIDDFEKRVILYLDATMVRALDFWRSEENNLLSFSDIASIATGSHVESIRQCCKLIEGAGGSVIRKVCTPADVEAAQLSVVKVMIPQFAELEGDHNIRFLGSRRVREVPVRVGYRESQGRDDGLNVYPHPLP